MKYNKDLDFFRAILIGLVILIHIVNFGNIYPDIKNAILAFFMPAFLVITGYLVNIEKTLRQFALYLWKIWLPYMLLVLGFAGLSLYLPVRDGITSFDVPTVLNVLFVKSIGPYWFLHVMMVCGILYYAAFRALSKLDVTAKYSLFAALLIGVSLFTPLLDIHAAFYYFLGVGVRQYIGDFSRIYKASLWPILPFGLLIVQREYWSWGTIVMLVCVVSFFFLPLISVGSQRGGQSRSSTILGETLSRSISSIPYLRCSRNSTYPSSASTLRDCSTPL